MPYCIDKNSWNCDTTSSKNVVGYCCFSKSSFKVNFHWHNLARNGLNRNEKILAYARRHFLNTWLGNLLIRSVPNESWIEFNFFWNIEHEKKETIISSLKIWFPFRSDRFQGKKKCKWKTSFTGMAVQTTPGLCRPKYCRMTS